jgi:hypothetical protein
MPAQNATAMISSKSANAGAGNNSAHVAEQTMRGLIRMMMSQLDKKKMIKQTKTTFPCM